LLAPDFKSARISMAHQKVPAVPEIAIAARMAVNREAPNKVIAAIRRCSPYWALCHAFLVPPRPGIPAKAHIHRMTTRTRDAAIFVSPIAPEIRPNTTFRHGDAEYGGQSAGAGASFDRVRPDCSASAECTRKSDMGLIPIKLGVASGQRGDAGFSARDVSASWSALCRHDILTAEVREIALAAPEGRTMQ
jgi:hypothetical protein